MKLKIDKITKIKVFSALSVYLENSVACAKNKAFHFDELSSEKKLSNFALLEEDKSIVIDISDIKNRDKTKIKSNCGLPIFQCKDSSL